MNPTEVHGDLNYLGNQLAIIASLLHPCCAQALPNKKTSPSGMFSTEKVLQNTGQILFQPSFHLFLIAKIREAMQMFRYYMMLWFNPNQQLEYHAAACSLHTIPCRMGSRTETKGKNPQTEIRTV